MLIATIFLSLLVVAVLCNITSGVIKSSYNLSTLDKKGFLTNPYSQLKIIYIKNFNELNDIIQNNPDLFKDKNYVNTLNEKFKNNNSYIIVKNGNNLIYEGKKGLASLIKDKKLVPMDSFDKHPALHENSNYILREMNFNFTDSSIGTIYIAIDTIPFNNILSNFTKISIITIILIICASTAVMAFKISKSIIDPVETLKKATIKIQEGNLDFDLKPYSTDEMGDLCKAFDEMRIKLKESIELQTQYENNRKELVSNISHDLKTPITAIKGYIEGIQDGIADTDEKMERYIKTIYNKSISMDKLIDELMLYSKLDLNKLTFTFEKVDITAYLQDFIEDMQFDLNKNNITVTYKNNCMEPVFALIDREKINRVMLNIVNNSVKYMDKDQGFIEVTLDQKDSYSIIKIKDNGRGISKGSLPYIFNRFYREDLSRNQQTGGSGLGLAICKKIIEEHGGTIQCESEKGIGTTITFTLKPYQES